MQLNKNAYKKIVSDKTDNLRVRKVKPAARPRRAPQSPYTSPSQVKIYINPGHGGHGSNDRGMTIYPFASGDPEGFWESNSNLDKGLKLEEWLLELGMQVKMSRHTNNDGGGNDADILDTWLKNGKITQEQHDYMLKNGDDRSLSAIVAEANAYGADFMLSIHSNAGGPSNYPLELYSGQDENDPRTYRNPAPRQAESRAISTIIAKWLVKNQITTWSPASRANGWVIGDKTFGATVMGGWGDGYGVLRRLAVPGVISEGCMHDYIPETYRLMNMDYKWRESFYFMAAFCEYFLGYTLPKGAIGGQVRDWYKKMEFPKITKISGSRDELLPILGAKVTLLQNGTVKQTYTTDSLYNGVFFFWNLDPGKYTVRVEADHYYTMEKEVTVVSGDIAYQDMLVNAKRETRPEVVSYTPHPKNITDSVDVSVDVVLNFNWDMKEAETRAAFSISPAVDGTVRFENSYRTLRFHPDRMLEKGTEYTVTLAKTACHPDTAYANTLAEDFVMHFRTKDRPNLRLMQTYPPKDATDIPLNPSFIMIFDERIKSSTGKANLSVVDAQGNIQSINTRSFKYNTQAAPHGFISFELVNALEADKDYKLVIAPNLQDVLGIYHNLTTEIPFHTTSNKLNPEGNLMNNMETLAFEYDAEASYGMSSASAFLNKERKYQNAASNELKYVFAADESMAMYKYTGEIFDANGNDKLGMYIFADFSENEVEAVFDASGDRRYAPLCVLDYAGWHYEEADMSVLPVDVDYQFMGLRLVKNDGFLSQDGSFYVDNLYFKQNEKTRLDNLTAQDIVVAPNPANSSLTVLGVTGEMQLMLYSLDGKQVKTSNAQSINVEDVESGMYLLRITTDNDNVVKSVIIAH